MCSGETGQESSILQPQTGRRRRKHKARKITNKSNPEVNATSSGNDLSCNIPGFNNAITCDDKETVSLEHTKSVEESGMKTNSEINMLDAFVSRSSGDNNNQDVSEPSNAQYFDAYDNIAPGNEHLVQQQMDEEQMCNCNEFSSGGETLCAWCFVTDDGQRCRPRNSWNELDSRNIELETNESSNNQEFSYAIEGLTEESYALPVVSFTSNEMLERCSGPMESAIETVLYEPKEMEDMNDRRICSSNSQQMCNPYIEHTTKPFKMNAEYNVEDNSGFYEKECDESAHMNIMEYADGYYDSSGVYCFASVYESNKEAQDNSLQATLSGSTQEMSSDFFDAHSSEHFISIPSQSECVEPLSADINYRFPDDYEHVSSNLGNMEQHDDSDNNYGNYRNDDLNNIQIFSDSGCQNNDFINEKHLLRGIDELLLNKEECINDVRNMDALPEAISPQFSENDQDTEESNKFQAENLSSNNYNSIMDEGYGNEEPDDEMENIITKGKAQFELLNTSTRCEDTTSGSTTNSEPSTPNNSIDLKNMSDEEKSVSGLDLQTENPNDSELIVNTEPVNNYTNFQINSDFSDAADTMSTDTSEERAASNSFVPTDMDLRDTKQNQPDKAQYDFIHSSEAEAAFRSEERTSSFVTTFTLDDIQEKMQTELPDRYDDAVESKITSGITTDDAENLELNEGADIQAHSTVETESILSVKSVAEIIEFYNKLNDIESEDVSREFNKCVKVREVPASQNLKCENTVFTESGTCLCVQESDMNNSFPESSSNSEIINKVKGIKSESSTFSKHSYSEYAPNNSISNSELHSREMDYLKREFKIDDENNVIYVSKFDNPEEVLQSFPYDESYPESAASAGNSSKEFSNHYFTNIGSGISNLSNDNSQSDITVEGGNESVETGKPLQSNANFRFSDLATALNCDNVKYYSNAFMNENFISVDEDYDIDAIQIKQHEENNGMFWHGNLVRAFAQDVQRPNNSENKLNSEAVLSEKLSLRSVERINDENNFTGSEVSSPRSVNNSIPKVAFEDILYSYCSNINKKSTGMKNLIKTGVSVKELAKGFDTSLLSDAPKEPTVQRKTQPDLQDASSTKVNRTSDREKNEAVGGYLSNESQAQNSEKKPSTSSTNIKNSPNSKIDGLIKEFGEKGAFRRKRRNVDSEYNTETHKCLCMSKSTNAIVTDDKSDMMRAVNEMSCQNVDCPGKAHLYHHNKKHGQKLDCSSNVSVKDIISFFTNYPDFSKADNTTDEYTACEEKAKCCQTNSFSNLCDVCDRKQKCPAANVAKKIVAPEGQNELVVVLTEPETGGVLESRSDNIFLDDRRAASVPFVMCSRPESLMRLNKGEGGNKFLLVLPDVHKLWMKSIPGGKGTMSQLTEFIQKSSEDIDHGSAVSVKDLVARWNQNSSTSQ